MNRRLAVRQLMAAGAVSLIPRLDASRPQEKEEPEYTLHSEARLVLLDVSVKTDKGHQPVSGLQKENFVILEDGRPQTITVFANEDLPVTVGILMDESQSMTPKRADCLIAAQTFIAESNPEDEIFVLNFNETVRRGLPDPMLFSGDSRELRSALYRGVPEGKTALNDAVVTGLDQLVLGKRDKKALVVISDGGDNASRHKRSEMVEMVQSHLDTIYTIGLYDSTDFDRDPRVLRELARISGGEAWFPARVSEMVPICRAIAKDIRARYTIGYVPEAGAHRDPLRHIHVRVSAPGRSRMIARTRTSYRYDAGEHGGEKG